MKPSESVTTEERKVHDVERFHEGCKSLCVCVCVYNENWVNSNPTHFLVIGGAVTLRHRDNSV